MQRYHYQLNTEFEKINADYFIFLLANLSFISKQWIDNIPGIPSTHVISYIRISGTDLVLECMTNDTAAAVELRVQTKDQKGTGAELFGNRLEKRANQTFLLKQITNKDDGEYVCVAMGNGTAAELKLGKLLVKEGKLN